MPDEPTLPDVAGLAAYLGALLGADRYAESEHGVFAASERPVRRLGLALDGGAPAAAWARDAALDALWLHRPWRLPAAALPAGVGVLFTHLPFDDRLTTGLNPRLATALGATDLEPYGEKEGRVIGMLGRVSPVPAATLRDVVAAAFGGMEAWVDAPEETPDVRRVAVVGAMTDALVRGAAQRGAGLYVTGQLRAPGLAAARATGVAVAAVGHAAAERWGTRALAGLLRERWAALDVVVEDGPGSASRG